MNRLSSYLALFSLFLFVVSCKSIYKREKVYLPDTSDKSRFSSKPLSSYKPIEGDSIIFEITPKRLKEYISQNEVVWLHFVYSELCADAKLYDCETYKKLNKQYREKMKYVMVTEIAHLKLAQELKKGCNLVGHHTYIDNPDAKIHNEIKDLRKFKMEVFNFNKKDTLSYQTNYLIVGGKIMYASDQSLDIESFRKIFNNL
jgi:hypothetical protein